MRPELAIALGASAAGAVLGGVLAMFGSWVAERRSLLLRRREQVEADVRFVDSVVAVVCGYLCDPSVRIELDTPEHERYQAMFDAMGRIDVSLWAVPRKRRAELRRRLDVLTLRTTVAYSAIGLHGRRAPKSLIVDGFANMLSPALYGEKGEAYQQDRQAAANAISRAWWGEELFPTR